MKRISVIAAAALAVLAATGAHARSFDAIPDQLVKKKLYALLLNEIRIASNASRQPAAAPTPTPVPTVRRAPGKSPA